MKKIAWEIMIMNGKIATIEKSQGFPQDDIESHITLIGLLENLKQKHLDKLKTLYEKTVKKGDDEDDIHLDL